MKTMAKGWRHWIGLLFAACMSAASLCCCAASNVEPPVDPGYEVSVIASDVIAEVEIVAGGPFRAVALVKKTLKGDAPKVIELEGFNSFNWDTVHHGLLTGARCYMFLSKTEWPDVFVPLTPAAPRFISTAEGVMTAFGDPPVRFPVKAAALEQGLTLLIEKNATGKVPASADSYLHGLWDQGEIEGRYLAVEMGGALRDERALPILLEASKDKLLKLRLRSVEALGKVGTPNALSALRSLLRDEKKSVAREAARVLAQLKDTESLPALLEWVRKNASASGKLATGGGSSADTDRLKTEAAALDSIALAKAAGTFSDIAKISRSLLEIARLPNEKLADEAIDASLAIAPAENIPAIIELAQDRLYEQREHAFTALRRFALKPVRDIDEFQAWWKLAGSKFNEDTLREAAEAAGREMAHAEEYEERHKALDVLRGVPGGIALVTSAPFLMNVKTSNYFGEEDLANWNSPLALPFLFERMGRDSTSTRKSALDGIVAVCGKNQRLAALCWPLIRAQLSERDSGIRKSAENVVGTWSKADGIDALLDGVGSRGIYEPQDVAHVIYSISARTFGFSINEPQPDQILARKHFRGWWDGARKTFRPLSVSTPVNPFTFVPDEGGKLRVFGSLDDAARAAKLEAQALLIDSNVSEAAFSVLLSERGADDPFWKKMMSQTRSRDRARGLVGSIGSVAAVPDLIKRINSKAEGETPLTRALILLSLGASGELPESKGEGPKAVVAWLKASDMAPYHPMKRLGVLALGLANKEPESLAFLTEIVETALKADAPDPDTAKPDEQNGPYALLRSAVIALCAREDGSAVLLKLLNESDEPRMRETAARTLSLRRDRAAVPGIVKALEKSDRYTWLDLTYTLEPLLSTDDGAVLREMLDSSKNSTRAAAAWLMSRRLDLGNDPQTRAKLIAALSDEANLVRYYAAESLGKRKAKAAIEALVKLLDDIDDDVKAVAAQALGEIGDKEACVLASKAALGVYRIDARWMKALALSGNAKWMIDILKLANSNLYMEQRAGLEALSASDTEEATERILKAFRSDDETFQTLAVDLLAERGDSSLKLIKEDLNSKDKATRARALHFLARLNSPAAKAALNDALKTEEDPAVKALIEWGIARGR